MLSIRKFTVEHLPTGCVTDKKNPDFAFAVDSDRQGAKIQSAELSVNGWKTQTVQQHSIAYEGPALKPFTRYEASICVQDDAGETAESTLTFETGRMDTPWQAQWISDAAYSFQEKGVSPIPMVFRKTLKIAKPLRRATVYATALGIYELDVDGQKLGNQYFAPGFTSYPSHLQYQTYDATSLLKDGSQLTATVAGGWAVGSFVFTRKNRYAADRQALLLEVRLEYEDGEVLVIGSTDIGRNCLKSG